MNAHRPLSAALHQTPPAPSAPVDAAGGCDTPNPDAAHELAREEALEEFEDWQRADYDRREFEDFGNWLANKARWNRPNRYEDALTYAERPRDWNVKYGGRS